MLHEDPLMVDIDVDHWRNLQDLLLSSAKERRRIIVIHEDGKVLKLVHSHRVPFVGAVEEVESPQALAKQLYENNASCVDFVAVFERQAFDEYFGRFQATWRPDEDVDEYVHRAYELIDEYSEALVTYPGRARNVLGLQWRVGTSYEAVKAAVKKFVAPVSTVVFGVFDGDELWTTLVLAFDGDLRVKVVTTVDPSALGVERGRVALSDAVVKWVNRTYGACSIGLFTTITGARAFLDAEDKLAVLRELAGWGELLVNPVQASLSL